MIYKERVLKILQANDLFSYCCVSLSQINMQQKLEELCQIETVLLLETVNVANLSQEHQVCSRVLQECSFDTITINTPWRIEKSNFEKCFTGCSRKIA